MRKEINNINQDFLSYNITAIVTELDRERYVGIFYFMQDMNKRVNVLQMG